MTVVFCPTAADLRAWLDANHDKTTELLLGFFKKRSGKPSITWPEAVDQALCFGWIDGVRKAMDMDRYMIRFTPRKPRSHWSLVNIKRVEALTKQGLMRPEGLKAFELRLAVGNYSHEQSDTVVLSEAFERQFRAQPTAWAYFQNQPPSYRKAASWWVISAKREDTRQKRLDQLVEDSANERAIRILSRTPKTK